MPEFLPLFLNLTGRLVVLVGGGRVAAAKLRQLVAVGARVRIVAPEISPDVVAVEAERARPASPWAEHAPPLQLIQRAFVPADLDDAWLVVAAATPAVNRQVAEAAGQRRLFVNAVDDPANASAFLSGVVRRGRVTIAISTSGDAPALTALLREGLDALLPRDLDAWMETARGQRVTWRRDQVPMDGRKPRLLDALNALYEATAENAKSAEKCLSAISAHSAVASDPNVPWLNAPEDSWL